jgi:hypothetical protein
MTSIFSTTEKKLYRDMLSRLVMVLELLTAKPFTNWRLSVRLETTPASIDKITNLAIDKGLVTFDGKYYKITNKGRDFLEVLRH